MLFWLFLGGFVWVIGDIFQQYATKYLGIGRGIPLSNTNQLWGLAWGALVFGELAHADATHRCSSSCGSLVMILGALAVSTAVATEREHTSTNEPCSASAIVIASTTLACCRHTRRIRRRGGHATAHGGTTLILACAVGVFVWLGDARPAYPRSP